MANDEYVADKNLVAENRADRSVLAFKNACDPSEGQQCRIDSGGFHNAAIRRNIAVQTADPPSLL